MKRLNWQVVLGLVLVVLSALFYILHYVIFRDTHHIFIYLLGDVAFVFIEVLLVTLIIHRLLGERERQARLEKLNMVIGAFFSEVGAELLDILSGMDLQVDTLRRELIVAENWSRQEFVRVRQCLERHDCELEIARPRLQELKQFLVDKSDFLLRLLENPNLLEHESFTELLHAVFHFAEELAARDDLGGTPASDHDHLLGDARRVYTLLAREWLEYMEYLRDHYPYLFSFAMRTNPFDRSASPVVQ